MNKHCSLGRLSRHGLTQKSLKNSTRSYSEVRYGRPRALTVAPLALLRFPPARDEYEEEAPERAPAESISAYVTSVPEH